MIVYLTPKEDCILKTSMYSNESFKLYKGRVVAADCGDYGIRLNYKENHWSERFNFDFINTHFSVSKYQNINVFESENINVFKTENLSEFILRNRFVGRLFVSRMELHLIDPDQLNENIQGHISDQFARALINTGKLNVTKEVQENEELLCESELFVFTRSELEEMFEIAKRYQDERDSYQWGGVRCYE